MAILTRPLISIGVQSSGILTRSGAFGLSICSWTTTSTKSQMTARCMVHGSPRRQLKVILHTCRALRSLFLFDTKLASRRNARCSPRVTSDRQRWCLIQPRYHWNSSWPHDVMVSIWKQFCLNLAKTTLSCETQPASCSFVRLLLVLSFPVFLLNDLSFGLP